MTQTWGFLFGYTNIIANGAIVLITILSIVVYKFRQQQEAEFLAKKNYLLSLSVRQMCYCFSFYEMKQATSNFDDTLVIGKGGFGNVYKGTLAVGDTPTAVAIKRLNSMSNQGSAEFLAEIQMLTKLRHSHLVSLIGYCDEGWEMILVYEFMAGGTLADHLYKRVRQGDTSLRPLSWVQRLKICIGAAQGLHYLHSGTGIQHRIIHRDVKATNILLDENFAAKISDFGLSKISPANQATTYVLCGRPAVDRTLEEEQIGLAGWAQHCFGEEIIGKIIEPRMKEEACPDSLELLVKVAIQCIDIRPKHRPTMAEVLVCLESALALQTKSTEYYLPEIIPSHDDQVEKDRSDFEVESENYGTGKDNIANIRHQKKQPYAMQRFVAFLSVTAQTISASREAKTARDNGVLTAILKSSKLKSYTFKDLNLATRKFNTDGVLGTGFNHSVYEGWVDESTFSAARWGTGMPIAVKRLRTESRQVDKWWLTGINNVGKLSHPNIVKLIGYCCDKKHRLQVYEYMPQGSLDTHLFKRDSDSQPLSWKLRISIALGAARALAYLHSPETNLIHRDIKPSKILIDSNYNAKLSGFGSAKDGPRHEETHVTTLVQGTFGYADPEYFMTSQVTTKSDVYSFGVVLLNILTGRKAILRAEEMNLASWAHSKEHVISDIMDADINGQYTAGEASKAFSLALKCTSEDSKSRPNAKQVVEELDQLLASINLENINKPTESNLSKSTASPSTGRN
ncbi:hypothetical protein AgCh_002735 [Apium graveolens]